MKKIFAGMGVLAFPFSAVVGTNAVLADGGMNIKQQKLSIVSNENKDNIMNDQSAEKGNRIEEAAKEKAIAELFGAKNIKDEAFSTKIATLETSNLWLKICLRFKEKRG